MFKPGTIRQKEAVCKRCGKPIWLVECAENGKWISCDREIRRFQPGTGTDTYVMEDGRIVRGGKPVTGGEYGYRKHRKDCDR